MALASRNDARGTTGIRSSSAPTIDTTPATARNDPSSPSSPMKPEAFERLGRDLAVGGQQPDRDRQIEPRAALALVRRREVDRHPARRPRQSRWTSPRHGHDRAIRGTLRREGRRSGSRASPVDTCTSTVTGRPSTPSRVAERTAASMRGPPATATQRATHEHGWKGTEPGPSTVSALYPPTPRPQPDDTHFSVSAWETGRVRNVRAHSLLSRAVALAACSERRSAGDRRPVLRDGQREPRATQRAGHRRRCRDRRDVEALPLHHVDRAARRAEGMGDDDLQRGGRARPSIPTIPRPCRRSPTWRGHRSTRPRRSPITR